MCNKESNKDRRKVIERKEREIKGERREIDR